MRLPLAVTKYKSNFCIRRQAAGRKRRLRTEPCPSAGFKVAERVAAFALKTMVLRRMAA